MSNVGFYEGYCDYCDTLSEYLVYSKDMNMICMGCITEDATHSTQNIQFTFNEETETIKMKEV